MGPSAPYHTPGSRAIKIPLHPDHLLNSHKDSAGRRQRSGLKYPTPILRADTVEHGQPSSAISESWSTSSPSFDDPTDKLTNHYLQRATASPSNLHPTESMNSPTHHQQKDKHPAVSNDAVLASKVSPQLQFGHSSPLGPSMLSSSAYKSVNLSSRFDGEPEHFTRLITYTKHSQGFTWNDELFLPSHMVNRSRWGSGRHGGSDRWSAGRRQHDYMDVDQAVDDDDHDDGFGGFDEDWDRCPVTDIFVTDEESAAMMP